MGFDLYGVGPKAKSDYPEFPESASKKSWDKYSKLRGKFEEENPGYYFRNNIWYWSPLWHFVCDYVAPKILSAADKEAGEFNDGYVISAIKANYIADKIDELDEKGELVLYEQKSNEARDELPEDHWGKNYPFEAENVRDFAKFARNSGGFEIS